VKEGAKEGAWRMASQRVITLPADVSSAAHQLPPLSHLSITGRSGRKLLIVKDAKGGLSALDAHCHHHGADLGRGEVVDIEDVGSALRCPAHGYLISVGTGERILRAERGGESCWQRQGVAQRTHAVVTDDKGVVSVHLSDRLGCPLPSDAYNLACPAPASARAPAPSSGQIAFTQRKHRAVEAVSRSVKIQRVESVPYAPSAAAPPPHPKPASPSDSRGSWRQTTLDAFAGGRPAVGSAVPTPEEGAAAEAMAID
jgi:nitrite reductase/ring-hydroxylating ferredoxin subunit